MVENIMRPIHPGSYLGNELEHAKISIKDFARESGIDVYLVKGLIGWKYDLTEEIAIKIGKYFGTDDAELWLNLQKTYNKKIKLNSEALSPAKEAIHETASDLYAVGAIDKNTMKNFDKSCLALVKIMSGDDIKALRIREGVTQKIFAIYMNVGEDTISAWERGVKHPLGATLRLLNLFHEKGL